jgi:hypothetical protein
VKAVGWRERGKLEVEGLERKNRGQILEAAASARPTHRSSCLLISSRQSIGFEKRGRGVGMKTIAEGTEGKGEAVMGDGRWG